MLQNCNYPLRPTAINLFSGGLQFHFSESMSIKYGLNVVFKIACYTLLNLDIYLQKYYHLNVR